MTPTSKSQLSNSLVIEHLNGNKVFACKGRGKSFPEENIMSKDIQEYSVKGRKKLEIKMNEK